MVPHTRTILTPSPSHQYHRMLLYIVTLSRNITRHDPPRAKSYSRRLPFCRIGFLGLRDTDFDADAFELGGVDVAEGGRDGFSCSLGDAAALFFD